MSSPQFDVNTSRYDTGEAPFRNDTKRGKWSASGDFFFACICHVFGSTHFIFLCVFSFAGVLAGIVPLLISLIVFNVPMFFIQSFLGQFSSTGYISAFRIVPIMKGMGYVILVINLISMIFGSISTAVSLLYLFNTLRYKLPWMNCNNSYNSQRCDSFKYSKLSNDIRDLQLSSIEYYRYFIRVFDSENSNGFAWPVFGCILIVWGLALIIIRQNTEWIGKLLRWSCLVTFVLLLLIIVRSFFLLPSQENRYLYSAKYSLIKFDFSFAKFILQIPIYAILLFGSGWGNVLSLASYNNFKTDIHFWSWTVCVTIFVVNLLAGIAIGIMIMYADGVLSIINSITTRNPMQFVFCLIPFVLGSLEQPNLWNFIYFTLLFIGEMSTIVVQLHSAITALCDEYEYFREKRLGLTVCLTGSLITISTLLCFTNKFYYFGYLMEKQVLLLVCLLMILLVLWMYGRVRLQRDVQFMIGRTFSNWQIFMVRFITPLIILTGFLLVLVVNILLGSDAKRIFIISIIINGMIFFIILIYMIVKLFQTTGSIGVRLRRLFRVKDWYPANTIDRQRYEEALGTTDISHQLVEMEMDMEIDLEDVDGYGY